MLTRRRTHAAGLYIPLNFDYWLSRIIKASDKQFCLVEIGTLIQAKLSTNVKRVMSPADASLVYSLHSDVISPSQSLKLLSNDNIDQLVKLLLLKCNYTHIIYTPTCHATTATARRCKELLHPNI